jgi:hypothetical protein
MKIRPVEPEPFHADRQRKIGKAMLLVSVRYFEEAPINPLNAKLNLICHLLALLGAQHILHVSGLRVKKKNFKFWNVI